MSSPVLRPERPDDRGAIRDLTAEAFAPVPYSNGEEPDIIDRLRAARALALSLVAEEGEGTIVGHAAFSPAAAPGEEDGWYALGPVAVRPERQGRGTGSALIRRGLKELTEGGARGCILVGDPGYYARFGFAPAPELAPPDQPAEYYMVRGFEGYWPSGPVGFHAAFRTAE